MEENTTKVQNRYPAILCKLPGWLISAVIIFPVLAISGIALNLISLGKIQLLFWMILPSIFFEELFETSYIAFSDSQFANLVFIIIFWFSIGAIIELITSKLKNISHQ